MSYEQIEEYNMFLAGELSAVETYDLALKTVHNRDIRQALVESRNSHLKRVNKLTDYVLDLDGEPAGSSGVWGPFAEFVQKSAASETDAIVILEQSEAERLVRYEAQQKLVVSPVLEVLTNDLLKEQHASHLTISSVLRLSEPIPG